MTIGDVIVERIDQLCKKKKITINKLATLSNVPQSTLKNIMLGDTKSPNITTLYKIASTFNMTLSEFLDIPALNDDVLEEI